LSVSHALSFDTRQFIKQKSDEGVTLHQQFAWLRSLLPPSSSSFYAADAGHDYGSGLLPIAQAALSSLGKTFRTSQFFSAVWSVRGELAPEIAAEQSRIAASVWSEIMRCSAKHIEELGAALAVGIAAAVVLLSYKNASQQPIEGGWLIHQRRSRR